jgi:hypothetical protein
LSICPSKTQKFLKKSTKSTPPSTTKTTKKRKKSGLMNGGKRKNESGWTIRPAYPAPDAALATPLVWTFTIPREPRNTL